MASAAPAPEGRSFRPLFERWSRRVRAQLALGHVLGGAALGLLLGAGASAALWQTRHGALRPAGIAVGLAGAAAGLALARRRRWPDADVALYLDARLDADEAIATAVELTQRAGEDPARAVVISQAASALGRATPAAVRAPFLRPWHAALPVAAAAIAWISVAPLPPLPAGPPPAPGAGKVQLAQVAGLEKVIKLAEQSARDAAQRERLKKLAEEAKKLRDALRQGIEKREAQAEIARIKDGLRAERLSLGDGEQRQGMESALGKLGDDPDLKNVQKALGDRDLVRLDEEMERLANKLESNDRQRAQQTLEDAAEASRRGGAPDVARALEQQKKRLAELGKKADRLRELAKELGDALGDEGQQALQDFDEKGSGKEAQKLAEKLAEALDKLTPEQRKKLAENLKKKAREAHERDPAEGPSKRDLKDLADQLDTPEGQQQLEDALKKMAEAPPGGSEEGERQQGLDDAEDGADEAEKELGGGMPMPMPGPGGGKDPGKAGDGAGKDGDGPGVAGHTEGGGPGSHRGTTGVVEGGEMRARAAGRLGKGRPMPGVVMGRSAGRAGDTANGVGPDGLGSAAAGEIGGVERSDVPEEYREQVGRYFQPR